MPLFGKSKEELVIDGSICFQRGVKARKESLTKAVEWFRKGAEEFDHGECQYALGKLYLRLEIGTKLEMDLVVHWYKKAIINGVSSYELPFTLGLIYLFGKGDIINEEEALKWIKKAAEDVPQSYTVIGEIYYHGILRANNAFLWQGSRPYHDMFTEVLRYLQTWECKDYKKALEWYMKATKILPANAVPAERIAQIYLRGGYGVGKDYQKALEWSELSRKENNDMEETAKIIVAVYKEGGYGVERDVQKALRYCLEEVNPLFLEAGEICQFCIYPPDFEKAAVYYQKATKWSVHARLNLGYLYLKGLGVMKSVEYSKRFLNIYFYQGYFCHYGIGTAVDYDNAQEYYEKYQIGGEFYGKALNQLGLLQQKKSEDFKEALRLFNLAVEVDCSDAFNSLGDVYKYGYGVDVDYAAAFEWYTKAAQEPMDNGGQFNLGMMYSEGKGTQIDYKLALYWFERAKVYGNESATDFVIAQTKMLLELSEKYAALEERLETLKNDTHLSMKKEPPKKFFYVEDVPQKVYAK